MDYFFFFKKNFKKKPTFSSSEIGKKVFLQSRRRVSKVGNFQRIMEVVSLSESVSPTTRKRSISFSFTPDNNNNNNNHAAAAKLDAVAKAKCAEFNKDSPLKRRRRQRLLNVASCSSDSVAQQHFVLLAQLSHTPRHQFATANSNVLKNRYPNILANESTRVRLARSNAASLSLSLLQTDYINANHIQLDNSPSKFILIFGQCVLKTKPMLLFVSRISITVVQMYISHLKIVRRRLAHLTLKLLIK